LVDGGRSTGCREMIRGGKLWKASFNGGCREVPVRMVRDEIARLRLIETWIWPEIRWIDGGGFVWSRWWWEFCDSTKAGDDGRDDGQ
jgi:hypothetical protein